MKKILAIMPVSIGGRLTTSSIIDGFKLNDFEVKIFDELKDEDFSKFLKSDYSYIIGYDFSPVKLKIDYNLKIPCIAYFSDVIQSRTSGVGYKEYFKYLKNPDIYTFLWDRELSKEGDYIYFPHFVNCEIYKNFSIPKTDVAFMGRFDTDLRLNTFIELNEKLPNVTFKWYAIERHYLDALSRTNKKDIIKKAYSGFIDNETDMADAINDCKIAYNINAQGKTSLNYRTMQVLACERLIISDERGELDLFNNIIPVWSDTNDLAQKIKYYLNNFDEYNKIVKKAREIIVKNHNSSICVKKMLNIIETK
ncbi:MAG: glycosyltransferase family 1 protein [Candidatus Gastranaerophilales bacterium]|nr:glycosyltransferase family 1 protein [Candidatus Gastranaerophilales bacterium]